MMKNNLCLRGHLAYDSVYKRERIIEESILGSDKEAFDTLYLYNTQIQYVFNLNTRQCQKQPLTRQWRDIGINPNSTSFGGILSWISCSSRCQPFDNNLGRKFHRFQRTKLAILQHMDLNSLHSSQCHIHQRSSWSHSHNFSLMSHQESKIQMSSFHVENVKIYKEIKRNR